jgi:hypothetical protein
LSPAGYVQIENSFKGNYPNPAASLSLAGGMASQKYRRPYKRFARLIEDDGD